MRDELAELRREIPRLKSQEDHERWNAKVRELAARIAALELADGILPVSGEPKGEA